MTEKYENGHDSEKQIPAGADNGNESFEENSDVIELSDIAIGITPEDDAIVELTEELIGEAFVGFAGAISEVLHDDEQRLDLSETTPGLGQSGDDSRSGIDSKAPELDPVSDEPDAEFDNLESDISQELDSYFGTDEGTPVIEETTPIAPSESINQAKSSDPSESINQAESSDQPESMLKTDDQPGDQIGDQIGDQAIEEKKIQLDEISISARHLDDALERVIRKMYAEKINRILDEIIERTVSEEISQLKDYLIGIAVKK